MKKNKKLISALAYVLTFVIGLLIGLFVDYPQVNESEFLGTIGKVNNYRNVKATKADIKLKNDLVANKKMLKTVQSYLTYYYAQSMEFSNNISFAIEQAKSVEPFSSKYKTQISAVENYGKFLEETRKELLLSIKIYNSLDASSPIMMRNTISRANNIISQMSYRNSTLINFIDTLDTFIKENGEKSYLGLNSAYNLLLSNQIGSSLATKNKALQNYLNKKTLYSTDVESPSINIPDVMIKDIDELSAILPIMDVEKLGFANDKETLETAFANDKETLELFYTDKEQLGLGYPILVAADVEMIGSNLKFDSEKLGMIGAFDSEKLGIIGAFDAEKLGTVFNDSEKLDHIVFIY